MARPEVTGRKLGAEPSKQPRRNKPAYEGPRILRLPEVLACTGLGRTKIYELMAAGCFPRPIKLVEGGRAIGWSSVELDNWLAERMAARDAQVA